MPPRPRSIRQISDHLCAEAAGLHKAISALPDNYSDSTRLALTNHLLGTRSALCHIHGGEPDPGTPSTNPAGAVITEWWQHTHPEDWVDDARRTRHTEQIYITLHQLLITSEHPTVPQFADAIGIPRATAYWVLANPGRTNWTNLEKVVKGLGAHRDEMWGLWNQAYKRPTKTIPPPAFGRKLAARRN
jgi:hypothetical protein